MKDSNGIRKIFWLAAAALVFGCSLMTGSIPGEMKQGSARDLNAFLPPSNTPFLPDFSTLTQTLDALIGDPPTGTFTVVIIYTATETPVPSPTGTLMGFPSITPTPTFTVIVLPTVTPTKAYVIHPSPTPLPRAYPSATPTAVIAAANSPTPMPTATPLSSGGSDQPSSTPTGTAVPTETSSGSAPSLPTVTPTPTATATPRPTATSTPTPASTGCVVYNYDYELQVASLLNVQRNQNGLPSLSVNGALTNSARGHSIDMVTHNLTQHNGSDGSTPQQRMKAAGYGGSWWGEIIYWGGGSYGTPDHAVTWWMNDPPHKDVILGTHYTDFGVGYVSCSTFAYKGFFTVDFGGP